MDCFVLSVEDRGQIVFGSSLLYMDNDLFHLTEPEGTP